MKRIIVPFLLVTLIAVGWYALSANQSDRPNNEAALAPVPVAVAPVAEERADRETSLSTDIPSRLQIPSYPRAIQIGTFAPANDALSIRQCTNENARPPVESEQLEYYNPQPCGQGGYPNNCPPCNGTRALMGVECDGCMSGCGGEPRWKDRQMIPWQVFAQGEYVGPARTAHVPEYRLRVDDQLDCVYRLTRTEMATPYKLNVGDEIQVESMADKTLDRKLEIQPDGTITLRLLGQVMAANKTVEQLRIELNELYAKYYKKPEITVTPVKVNTKLIDLLNAVDNRSGFVGGQSIRVKVTPAGMIQLPALGTMPAQGMTLEELQKEINERYNAVVEGLAVTPVLTERAPRYVFVLGEVRVPGRYDLTGPTTAMQAISMAGGWNMGGNVRQIVVFRRTDDWRLMATKLDLGGALQGHRPCPADEIWIRDSDIVLVPKSPIQLADEFIEMVFTRGIYGVMPFSGVSISFQKLSTI